MAGWPIATGLDPVVVPDRGRDAHCWAPPRTEPYVRLSRIRLPPWVCDGNARAVLWHCRTRSSACATLPRFCARCVLCRLAFPSAPALRSTRSIPGFPAPFAGFTATTPGSDFSCPCIAGYGSSPSRRGPDGRASVRSDTRPPRFRRVPFVRDEVFDPDRATAPRMTVPHLLPSAGWTASASVTLSISWLNRSPHTIAVYASWPPSPTELTQHSLPGGRYPLPGPDFHRLEPASLPGAPIGDLSGRYRHALTPRRGQAATGPSALVIHHPHLTGGGSTRGSGARAIAGSPTAGAPPGSQGRPG